MPLSITKTKTTPRKKQYLTKGGLQRDDSDDELGYEDHPWHWIYEDQDSNDQAAGEGQQQEEEDDDENPSPSKKRKASNLDPKKKRLIIGAQMGSFSVRIGDAILLKSPEQGKDWVGLACSFSDTNEDDEDEKCVHIQWFCTPEELMFGKRSKLPSEALPNESYITADFNMNPLTAINGKATILSKETFFQKYPNGQPPKSKSAANQYAKTVLCRRGVKQRTLQFTEDFVWEEIYKGPEDILDLVDWIKEQTKGRRRTHAKSADDQEYDHKKEPADDEPRTPSKRRKTTAATVSTTPKSASKYTTPTHKRIMIKKPIEITPLGTRILSPSQYMSTPYSQARATLHVSAVPTSLPCRTTEFSTVYSHLYSAIADGSGACIYISGTPGTGKTATVREVVSSLHQAVLADELDDFNFVEINGMKVTDPHQSYSLLWEALKGDRVSPAHALSLLEQEFSLPSPRRIPCVVLMDELDQLVTKTQSVMYNFFNWPAMRHSRLIVLAVANTMDLPERTLSNKISSRLGLTRITFPGYTHTQLMEIITSRLEGVPGNIVDKDAVQFASRKVAAVSGDARRALDICRRAVEIAEQAQEGKKPHQTSSTTTTTTDTTDTTDNDEADKDDDNDEEEEEEEEEVSANIPSRTGRNRSSSTKSNPKPTPSAPTRVTIATIKQAINEATSSPISQHLRSLSLAAKLFLAATLARTRRTGVAESTLGEVTVEAKRIADVAVENAAVREFLALESRAAGGELPRVLALGQAAVELVEAGVVAVEARGKGERAAKVRLRVGEEEVKSALLGDVEGKGMGFEA